MAKEQDGDDYLAFAIVFGAVSLLSTALYVTTKRTDETTVDDAISAPERVRRKFLFDDIRQSYLNSHPDAPEELFTGLIDPPTNYVNDILRSKGEKWKFKPESINKSTESYFYLECKTVITPIKAAANEPLYMRGIWPNPLSVTAGGGLGTSTSPEEASIDFGYKTPHPVDVCSLINYGTKTALDIVIGFSVTWQEVITDGNAQRGGQIHLSRLWRFDVSRLDPGVNSKFIFYIPNLSRYFVHISAPANLTARFVGEPDKYRCELSSNLNIPITIPPHD